MHSGEFEQARDILLSSLNATKTGSVALNPQNLYLAIDLAWVFKQLEQPLKAKSLLTKIEQAVKDTSKPASYELWDKIHLEAVKENTKQAALSYAELVESNRISYWWLLNSSPLLTKVIKQPEYIKAHQKLRDKLKKKRENLAKLEAEDKKP